MSESHKDFLWKIEEAMSALVASCFSFLCKTAFPFERLTTFQRVLLSKQMMDSRDSFGQMHSHHHGPVATPLVGWDVKVRNEQLILLSVQGNECIVGNRRTERKSCDPIAISDLRRPTLVFGEDVISRTSSNNDKMASGCEGPSLTSSHLLNLLEKLGRNLQADERLSSFLALGLRLLIQCFRREHFVRSRKSGNELDINIKDQIDRVKNMVENYPIGSNKIADGVHEALRKLSTSEKQVRWSF